MGMIAEKHIHKNMRAVGKRGKQARQALGWKWQSRLSERKCLCTRVARGLKKQSLGKGRRGNDGKGGVAARPAKIVQIAIIKIYPSGWLTWVSL